MTMDDGNNLLLDQGQEHQVCDDVHVDTPRPTDIATATATAADAAVDEDAAIPLPPPIHLTKELKRSRSRASKLERQRLALLKVERDDEIVNRALSILSSFTRTRVKNNNNDGTETDKNNSNYNDETDQDQLARRYKTLIERAFILGVCKGDSKRKGQQKRKESATYYAGLNGSFESVDGHEMVDDTVVEEIEGPAHSDQATMSDGTNDIDVGEIKRTGMESELQWTFNEDNGVSQYASFMGRFEDVADHVYLKFS